MESRRVRGQTDTTPPLDKRSERFVQRYLDSTLKLDLVRCLGQRPNRTYSLGELAGLTDSHVPEIERAVLYLERLGIVEIKRVREAALVSLSRSPVVRDTAVMTFRYTTRPGGYDHLRKIIRSKNANTPRRAEVKAPADREHATVALKGRLG
jgi:hypothetical protein